MNRTKLVMTEHSTQSLTSAASLFREEREVMSREGGGGATGTFLVTCARATAASVTRSFLAFLHLGGGK